MESSLKQSWDYECASGTIALLFHVDSGDKTQVLVLARQVSYRTESSSQQPGVLHWLRLAAKEENKSRV